MICRSILSLNEVARQLWCDHPFSQRNRTTKRTVAVGVGGDRELGGGFERETLKIITYVM